MDNSNGLSGPISTCRMNSLIKIRPENFRLARFRLKRAQIDLEEQLTLFDK
jgi:hypothetical protein